MNDEATFLFSLIDFCQLNRKITCTLSSLHGIEQCPGTNYQNSYDTRAIFFSSSADPTMKTKITHFSPLHFRIIKLPMSIIRHLWLTKPYVLALHLHILCISIYWLHLFCATETKHACASAYYQEVTARMGCPLMAHRYENVLVHMGHAQRTRT